MQDSEPLYPVEADIESRPIRVAFILPASETNEVHDILDRIVLDSFSRWGGAYSLLIPKAEERLDPRYVAWLTCWDPDYIYTYCDLSDVDIELINRSVRPMFFVRHSTDARGVTGPSRFTPHWLDAQRPMASASLLYEPGLVRAVGIPDLLTAFDGFPQKRFISDNFGVSLDSSGITNPVSGVFTTTCLCDAQLNPIMSVGTQRLTSASDALRMIREQRVVTCAQLASERFSGVALIREMKHVNSVFLTIGNTVADRISAWNRRFLTEPYLGPFASIRCDLEHLQDPNIGMEIAKLVDDADSGSSRLYHKITSASLTENQVRAVIAAHPERMVRIALSNAAWVDPLVFPDSGPLAEAARLLVRHPQYSAMIHREDQEIELRRPSHINQLPVRYGSGNFGAWVASVRMGRPENERKYVNVSPSWILPKRNSVTSVFVKQPARVSQNGFLEVLAVTGENTIFSRGEPKRKLSLSSPRTQDVLQASIAECGRRINAPFDYAFRVLRWRSISISDKGQNLRGVIDAFGGMEKAHAFSVNRHWREQLDRSWDKKTGRNKIENIGRIITRPSGNEWLQSWKKAQNLPDKQIVDLVNARIKDAVEEFIHLGILARGYDWRCNYCGNSSLCGVDSLKEKIRCGVCAREHLLPLKIEFSTMWNDFIYRTLIAQGGMGVLWSIGTERDRAHDCFAFMPEVDIYWDINGTKNEVDFLAIVDGKLVIGEAKRTIVAFYSEHGAEMRIESIIDKIRPDRVVLAFEFVKDANDSASNTTDLKTKMRSFVNKLRSRCDAVLLIGEDDPNYMAYTTEFGAFGSEQESLR